MRFIRQGIIQSASSSIAARTGQEVPEDVGSMCRVILYSLAVRYKEVLHSIESVTSRHIDVIHIVGGGSRNRLLNQLAANVTGRRGGCRTGGGHRGWVTRYAGDGSGDVDIA